MECKVYCRIGQQCKCVVFKYNSEHEKLQRITQKLRDYCERDSVLKVVSHGKKIVLQMKDKDKDIWCDVDEEDKIPNKSELKVIFVSVESLLMEMSSCPNFNFDLNEAEVVEEDPDIDYKPVLLFDNNQV